MDDSLKNIALNGRYNREYTGDEIYESLDKDAMEYNRRTMSHKLCTPRTLKSVHE